MKKGEIGVKSGVAISTVYIDFCITITLNQNHARLCELDDFFVNVRDNRFALQLHCYCNTVETLGIRGQNFFLQKRKYTLGTLEYQCIPATSNVINNATRMLISIGYWSL